MNASQKGASPLPIFLRGKNWNVVNSVYSLEVITLEWKPLSVHLRWLWNQRRTAYTFNVWPWPFTSGCKYGILILLEFLLWMQKLLIFIWWWNKLS